MKPSTWPAEFRIGSIVNSFQKGVPSFLKLRISPRKKVPFLHAARISFRVCLSVDSLWTKEHVRPMISLSENPVISENRWFA